MKKIIIVLISVMSALMGATLLIPFIKKMNVHAFDHEYKKKVRK